MYKLGFYISIILCSVLLSPKPGKAQVRSQNQDTFFLAKKKGLLGRFGKSISRNTPPDERPEKLVNPFLKYRGKIINTIILAQLDFGYNIYDTSEVQVDLGTRMANRFHRKSTDGVIGRNLFFKTGDRLFPYLLADNERYLRELAFIQDARILVDYSEGTTDSVDVVVLSRDVFSLGGRLAITDIHKGRAELKEENLFGSGNRVMISGYYESIRQPSNGFGAEWLSRNIGGSYIDLSAGYQNYRPAFNSGRNEETRVYAKLEKPLVTPYKPSTGALEWSYHKTSNNYLSDSLYANQYKYAYYNVDGWLGYSLDSRRSLYANREIKTHRFVALRGFTQRFLTEPYSYQDSATYLYADYTGVLASFNLFRQSFYRTSFIYGFGRTEDIPVGFSVALTGGYINKESAKRPYAGFDVQFTHIGKRASYYNYTFRAGGFFRQGRFEDVDLLFGLEQFSRLRKLRPNWYHRFFLNTSLTAQANPYLNTPLFLNSEYGMTYMNNESITADLRASWKAETVFYNMKKILGFRLAPFAFADLSLVKPMKLGLEKSDFFSALGGGIRTRNENLVFGTIELKGYYFPRTNGDMRNWKVELNSNIRFRYKSGFIRRPDLIIAN
ncbi:MAG: hypothetical protein IPP31_09140 [Chitinophagaceae bacterium]|nr:hypothetical protein [Chitinophagaceae bacterium]